MPVMDGYRVMEIMEEKGYLKHIPVLVISGEQAVAVERKCFDYGVTDFIRKPFDNELVMRRVRNMVDLFTYRNSLEEQVESQTMTLKRQYEMICRQTSANSRMKRLQISWRRLSRAGISRAESM